MDIKPNIPTIISVICLAILATSSLFPFAPPADESVESLDRLSAVSPRPLRAGDENWDDRFARPPEKSGLSDEVFAIAPDGEGVLYVGGAFDRQGDMALSRIAGWDDAASSWFPLGDGAENGVDGFVFAVVVDGPNVYVGGQFSRAGGVDAQNIACWSSISRTWSALSGGIGGGTQPFVGALAVWDGKLYAGGTFTRAGDLDADNIAVWDGTAWSPLGGSRANGVDGTVNALAFGHDGIYAGGRFAAAGEKVVRGIGFWNGNEWESLGKGVDGYVNTIAIHNHRVVVGGSFTRAGDTTARNIARYYQDGGFWRPLASPSGNTLPDGSDYTGNGVDDVVRGITFSGGYAYVVGTFRTAAPHDLEAAEVNVNYIARWNDQQGTKGDDSTNIWWNRLGSGLNGFANAVATIGSKVFVGGTFSRAGDINAAHVARWNGKRWSALAVGVNGPIQAMAFMGDDLFAAGSFNSLDGESATRIGRLQGTSWDLVDGVVNGPVLALATSADAVYIGGRFSLAGSRSALNVARWSRTDRTWGDLSFGVGGGDISFVRGIAVAGEKVYVAGRFSVADQIRANNIAVWDLTTGSWSALGSGVNGTVNAVAVDSDGRVYVGGDFSSAGGTPAANIAVWDGTTWGPLAGGTGGPVDALLIDGNSLYAGGEFNTVDGSAADNVARWEMIGRSWSPLGGGLKSHFLPSVRSLAMLGGDLVATGYFFLADGDSVHHVARWNGTAWSALGSGLGAAANCMVTDGSDLYVGGDFIVAGGKPSYYVAHWFDRPSGVDRQGEKVGTFTLTSYPNPFNSTVHIELRLGSPSAVRVEICDPLGRLVAVAAEGTLESGEHELRWESDGGPYGAYLLRVRVGDEVATRMLIRGG